MQRQKSDIWKVFPFFHNPYYDNEKTFTPSKTIFLLTFVTSLNWKCGKAKGIIA